MIRILYALALLTVATANPFAEPNQQQKRDAVLQNNLPFRCLTETNGQVNNFESLPGNGWDNIENVELSPVLAKTFSRCRRTADGKYLIPDQVTAVPLKESNVDVSAEVYEDMESYQSLTSKSINSHFSRHVNALFFSVSSTFSEEYRTAKKVKMEHYGKTKTLRVQARYLRYRMLLQPDSPLHPNFKARLMQIAKNHETNDTRMADYLSQLVIRDFGTHVLTSTDAGAALVKEDEVMVDGRSNEVDTSTELKVSSSLSFHALFGLVKAGAHTGTTSDSGTQSIDKYAKQVMHSRVRVFGGPYYKPGNFSAQNWLQGISNNLVTLDRKGEPIFSLVTPKALPLIPESTLYQVKDSLVKAYSAYFRHNLQQGCTNIARKNFNVKANVDDGTCTHVERKPSRFGGVYQDCINEDTANGDLCSSNQEQRNNPLTGSNTCPSGFFSTPIYTFGLSSDRSEHVCHGHWFWRKCHDNHFHSQATVTSYWCAPKQGEDAEQGYKFGGMYSYTRDNPLTGKMTCPDNYQTLQVGRDISVCVSDDSSADTFGMTFGGIYSCSHGNPLSNDASSNLPKKCPPNFTNHLAAIEDSCEVEYCFNFADNGGIHKKLPTLQRPPFMRRPAARPDQINVVLVDSEGKWFKNEKAFSQMVNVTEDSTMSKAISTYQRASAVMNNAFSTASDLTNSSLAWFSLGDGMARADRASLSGLSPGAVAAISSSTTLVCVVVASTALMACKRKLWRKN